MPFDQVQEQQPPGDNPLRRWLASQPLTVTQGTLAREFGITRSTISDLMSETNPKLPSLKLALKIEKRTAGAVTAAELFHYITAKKKLSA